MRCVLVSKSLDLRGYLGPQFMRAADRIEIISHPHEGPATDVRLAVAWHPPDDAFERYPNLQAVCSIGAGVDNILACPSLRPDVDGDPRRRPGAGADDVGLRGLARHRAISGALRPIRRSSARNAGSVSACAGRRTARWAFWALARSAAGSPPISRCLAFRSWRGAEPKSRRQQGVRGFHGAAGLDAMLGQTEVLVNLLPLTPETKGILNRKTFARMYRGGYLIQVGRGEHLVEADLLAALEDGQLAGAALDVFATEPLPPRHPFWRHPRIVVTPHDACEVSVEAIGATFRATADAIRAGRRPPHSIDRERGY
jgi:glyoxylate/hydroxypyruvate reductase A